MKHLAWAVLLTLMPLTANAAALGGKVYYTPNQPSGYQYWLQAYASVSLPYTGQVYLAQRNFLTILYCNTQQEGTAQTNFGRANLSLPQRMIRTSCDLWAVENVSGQNTWQAPNTSTTTFMEPPPGQLTGFVTAYQPASQFSGAYPVTVYPPGQTTSYSTWSYCNGADISGGGAQVHIGDFHGWECACTCP